MLKLPQYFLVILILFCFGAKSIYGQSSDIYLFIDSTTIIGKISDNQVFTSETNVAYTMRGNTIYNGDTTTTQQILFLVNAKDILSKKTGLVYQSDSKTIQYITRNSAFFLGDHPIDENLEKLLWMEPLNDSIITVYSGPEGKNIGFISGKFTEQVQIVAAAHMYIKHYHLDDQVNAQMSALIDVNLGSGKAYIRLANEYAPYFEWVWDGQILKPAWGYRPEDEWSFDGKYLKSVWSADPQSEWVWDGSILKPFWESGVENQWVWKDGNLKPFWDSNPDLMWILDGDIMRPMWTFDPARQWQVEGAFPLPLIAFVVLGKADR